MAKCVFFKFFKISIKDIHKKTKTSTLREKCPYLELFLSTFSRIRTEYGVFSPNAGKCGSEKLRIRTLFTLYNPQYEKVTFKDIQSKVLAEVKKDIDIF